MSNGWRVPAGRLAHRATRPLPMAVVAVAVAGLVLWWSVEEGMRQQRKHDGIKLGAAPLVARDDAQGWNWRFTWPVPVLLVLVALLGFTVWRGCWARWSTRRVLAAAGVGSIVFGVLLALIDGIEGLTYGTEHRTEYLANLQLMPPAGEFVRTFVANIDGYTVHARGHPPAFLLQLQLMDRIGLGGVWPLVVLTVLCVGVTAVAVLWVVHRVAGASWVRRVAPFTIVAPFAIWMVTSGDTVFTAVAAVGAALVAEALHRGARDARCGVVAGFVGGAALGWLMFLSYLGALFLAVPGALVLRALVRREGRRPWAALAAAVAGGSAVIGAFAAAGFWWFDGVDVTRREYLEGTAQFREWYYFRIGNLGAALMALGPAVVVGVAWLRDRRVWWVVGGAAVALATSHLSTYTKAEVERIWLPFYPFLLVAAAGVAYGLESNTATARRWVLWLPAAAVVAQGVYTIVLQSALVTKW